MLEPKSLELETPAGVKTFVLHKFPAIAGREIVTQYPITALPKLGEYKANEAMLFKLMRFVGVQVDGRAEPLMLTTPDLIDNHVGSWEVLARLEWAMIEYNCSFFGNGSNSDSFRALAERARPFLSQILTGLSERSSAQEPQPSTN